MQPCNLTKSSRAGGVCNRGCRVVRGCQGGKGGKGDRGDRGRVMRDGQGILKS